MRLFATACTAIAAILLAVRGDVWIMRAPNAPGRSSFNDPIHGRSAMLTGLPALHFSVSGGCSCELLARGPHKHEGIWELDPTQLAKLAVAIRALNSEARKYRFVAHLLGGETERTERRITGKELLRLVEENQVGDNVIYRTWSDGSK
jgi:hypothetical protein